MMSILKDYSLPNGTGATFWAIASLQYVPTMGTWNVFLGGYIDKSAYNSNKDPLLTRYFVLRQEDLSIQTDTATMLEVQSAIYTAILDKVNAEGSTDALNGAKTA